MECAIADSLEVFVADDTFKGRAIDERHLFDDFEIIREGHAREGGAALECALADRLEVFVPDDALEGDAFDERHLFDGVELI